MTCNCYPSYTCRPCKARNKERIAQAARTRRKTLFPLTPREVLRHQALLAWHLKHNVKLPIYAIRQVLQCSPERARSLVAKGARFKAERIHPPGTFNRSSFT